MEQLNFTKSSSIFEIIIHKYNFGLMIVGKLVWQQEEVRKEDISIALIIREQFSTSVLFRSILETILLILLLEEHCAFFGSHTFVPISWMCKKQTSVSHRSTESEIISLDAGLRLDGISALDLWDLIVAVLHGNTN